jgi:ribosomal protein S27AE
MLSLEFPTGMLFDALMRGGPLPDRYQHLGSALINPGRLDFEPEEAVLIREWLSLQPDDIVDVAARDGAIEMVNRALQLAGACSDCGGAFIAENQEGQPCCGRCGTPWEA